MSKVNISLVKGSSGYALNLTDDKGCGMRIAGDKPWGNPYNTPTASFELDADELIRLINSTKYD